jgi:mRNA interferase RelE/StbE
MKVEFEKSFLKSIENINNSKTLLKIEAIILHCESAKTLFEIRNIKKLSGFSNYFRIKIGDYRIGFELLDKETIRLIIFSHRKDIYKKFP